MLDKIIIDADLCIKLGCSDRYQFLLEILPLLAEKVYMHEHAYSEVLRPNSACTQLDALIKQGTVSIVNIQMLPLPSQITYNASYALLEKTMIDPRNPNKNKGEVCSLAYAKATGIPIFATDESTLQPIIDELLNTGIGDITCLRILGIVAMIKSGEIDLPRKYAKSLYRMATGHTNDVFDQHIWPLLESEP